jgi:hypothetical protein
MSNNATPHEVLSAISEAITAFDRVPGLLAEIERLTKTVYDKDSIIAAYESEVETLQSRINDLHDSINSDCGYKVEIELLKAERTVLQDENAVLSADNHSLREKLTEECLNGSRLVALVSLKDAEIASLAAQVSDNRSLADKFKSALDKIMGNINEVTPIEIAPTAMAPEVVNPIGFPVSNEPALADPLEGNSVPSLASVGNPNSATDEPMITWTIESIEAPTPNDLKPLGFAPETEKALEDFEATERRYGYWA